MPKKLIVAGGRHYKDGPEDWKKLFDLVEKLDVDVIITGGAPGADEFGRKFAFINSIHHEEVPADWDQHGRAAGPIRNQKMASMADAVVLFPGGAGTQSMFNQAKKFGLQIFDWRT